MWRFFSKLSSHEPFSFTCFAEIETVKLVESVNVPLYVNGKKTGEIKINAGNVIDVKSVYGNKIKAECNGMIISIDKEKTNYDELKANEEKENSKEQIKSYKLNNEDGTINEVTDGKFFTINVTDSRWIEIPNILYAKLGGEKIEKGKFKSTVKTVGDTTQGKTIGKQVPAVGDTVSLGFQKYKGAKEITPDSQWVVMNVKIHKNKIISNEEYGSKIINTDGKFIIVKFKVTNKTESDKEIYQSQLYISDSKRRQFKIYDKLWMYVPKDEANLSDSIPPSMSKIFYAMYEVPSDSKGLVFHVHTFETFEFESIQPPKPKGVIPLYSQDILLN